MADEEHDNQANGEDLNPSVSQQNVPDETAANAEQFVEEPPQSQEIDEGQSGVNPEEAQKPVTEDTLEEIIEGGDVQEDAPQGENDIEKSDEPVGEAETQEQPALPDADVSDIQGDQNDITAEAEPQVAEAEPQVAEAEPQVAEAEPQVAEAEPQVAEAEPQVAEAEPQVVDTLPKTETEGEDIMEDQEKQPENIETKTEIEAEDEVENYEEQADEKEPVQVETDVKEGPPLSPKIALEDKRSNVNLDATATVKCVLMPTNQVATLACTLGQSIDGLKSHFAVELKIAANLIMIMFDGKNLQDSATLADLGVGPNGTIQLEMQSADPVNTPLKPYRPRQEYHMPDVITVRVMTGDCESKDVVVEIERSCSKKPFLGGYRNKNSGVEFHNATAQTMKKQRPPPSVERFSRNTQTCEQKNMVQQTTNTTSTQMTDVGVFVSNMEDKLVVPGKYFCADDHWAMILSNVIVLQKYYRRWLAKRYVTKLKEDKARRLEWERQEELRKKKEKEERIKKDYARRLNPKTKADFDMLLHCLEKWRQEEMERINSTLTGAERKAALCMLLDQETELLSAIERHKNEANKDNRDNRIVAFLEKTAAPKKWQGHDGKLTYMDTPFTIRAKELRDIYNSINMKYLTQDERLDVLLTLKHTVKEHDCKLTQEIIELIDREADLLMRGVKEGNLTGLRKRISTLFLQYIKTPTFNPEAARLLKVPQDPSTLQKNIYYCHSCGRYMPSTEFFITSNSKQVGRCRNCMKVENDGRQREDYTFYRIMLKSLRKSEEAKQDGSSICYLLQENDLRYLVENIWSNQSVLSAWDDLYDLVLVRWDKHQEWSPWNCILLTHDEAEAHQKLFSLEEGYGQIFIHKVTQKHNFARNYFSRLPGMAELLRQKVGNRELVNNSTGPKVAGHTVPKAQKV